MKKKITIMDDIPANFFKKNQKKKFKSLREMKVIPQYKLSKIMSEATTIYSVKYVDASGNDIDKLVRNSKDMNVSKKGIWVIDINGKKKGVNDLIFIEFDKIIAISINSIVYIVKRTNCFNQKINVIE